MRVLWADDQEKVARTLSLCIGSSGEHRIVFVRDGDSALSKVASNFYDVAIIDLAMPPGRWGGLWLLEQLRNVDCRIPVLVLSGEGQQPETIRALRLGAREYVTKESAAADLKERIASVLKDLWQEIHKDVLTRFPTSLAVSYKRHVSSATAQTQMRTLIDIYEHTLRLAGVIGLAEVNREQAARLSRTTLARMSCPSMGAWLELCRALVRELPRSATMHQLWWALDEKNIAEIINTRNDVAHGSEPSDLNARTWLGPQGPGFRTFLTKLWQRLRFRIFFVVNSAYDGRVMVNECRALEGESPVLPNCQVQSDDRLVAREVYALPGVKAVDSILRLAPFLMLEPGHELNSWRSFVFDGWRGKASVPSGEEGLRYIEVWSGTRFDDLGKRLKAVPEFVWRS